MKVRIKSLTLEFILACLSFLAILACLFSLGGNTQGLYRDQVLPSGKIIKVTSFHLVWGVEHDDRNPGSDCFALGYVSSVPKAESHLRDQEALEVFELARPISEQWGFNKVSISAFQSTRRKGGYEIFAFKRSSDEKWSFNRYPAKVHIND